MSGLEILVADEDRSCLSALQSKLSAWGADVIVAPDGVEAMRVLDAARPPAFAILGSAMTGPGGLEICRRLRERGDQPPPYVVLLAAGQDAAELELGVEAGVDAILSRPVHPAQLRLCFLNGVRLLRLRRELAEARKADRLRTTRDGLTGLPDRAAVREALELELARSRRDGHAVGVLLVDVDHLRHVNETHGDAAGNAVLVEVAHRLREALRPHDTVGRHDGGEFLVVLPSCELEGATTAGLHLRAAMSDPIELDAGPCAVTVSIGVTAAVGLGSAPLEELVGLADEALRDAKSGGDGGVASRAPPAGLPMGM